jgi:hypothetical protein
MSRLKVFLRRLPQIGDIVLVKANSNDHSYTIGLRYRVIAHTGSTTFIAEDLYGVWKGNNLKYQDCYPGWLYEWEMEEIGSSKVVFQEKMQKLKTEMEELQRKIDFLNETGEEQFDAEEFKVYSTLKLFQNDKLTDVEKSKLIAKLIKGK